MYSSAITLHWKCFTAKRGLFSPMIHSVGQSLRVQVSPLSGSAFSQIKENVGQSGTAIFTTIVFKGHIWYAYPHLRWGKTVSGKLCIQNGLWWKNSRWMGIRYTDKWCIDHVEGLLVRVGLHSVQARSMRLCCYDIGREWGVSFHVWETLRYVCNLCCQVL